MTDDPTPLIDRLTGIKPFDSLAPADRFKLAPKLEHVRADASAAIFEVGHPLAGLYVIETGAVQIRSEAGDVVSKRGPGEIMGERGLLRDGNAVLSATATETTTLILIPAPHFADLMDRVPDIARWFANAAPDTGTTRDDGPYATGLMAVQVSDIMTGAPLGCSPDTSAQAIATLMRDRTISSVLVMEGERLDGIVTVHDLVNKVLAEGHDGTLSAAEIMTPEPRTISPEASGLDALLAMAERGINHLPVADTRGRILGMIGRTDLFRQQATTASHMASEIVSAPNAAAMARVMARLPELLRHLTAAGTRPAAISRRITDLTDAVTRRLLALAEDRLGPAPVPYLWAACGSQGRREQTGVSDQDNCLILDDSATPADDEYFAALARFVSDGLNEVGFIYCPGDMMATNPRWRQPRRVWQSYFSGWIREPDTEAQMLASVMFDLRPIAGESALFSGLQDETLRLAKGNSIFVHHMIANSLKHTPPLGFFGGLALIRSGENRNTLDLKHAGVVPVVDLGRVYALKAGIPAVNTRERLIAAGEAGVISGSGARDLLAAYDLICEIRLVHQAHQIARGAPPNNFLAPSALSDLEQSHLRDAFLVVKTMQSALGSSG